jgi:hypothetical protein
MTRIKALMIALCLLATGAVTTIAASSEADARPVHIGACAD